MTPTVALGIPGSCPDADDTAACAALRRHTAAEHRLVRLGHEGALGFNELLGYGAEVSVLLEPGARPGPRWLELLLEAVTRPGCGLAGPSTNRAWNEQRCVSDPTGDPEALTRNAAALARRFGGSARSLDPLYSLGAFCYAVRREVVDAIGPADPAYGEGPCWEMDYNARAARAGFAGLWVGAAYVHRRPPAAAVAAREPALLEVNRRLYQDRLCGLRLRGERDDYEPHCRGDRCEHFAPRDLLGIVARPTPPATTTERAPLVSCVMVTRERPHFAERAVAHFLRQSWPSRELVVVEDGRPMLAGRLPRDSRIRLVSSGQCRSIGAMRDQGCREAHGELIALWDDDDWHGPERLDHQVRPILAGRADITGLTDLVWFDLPAWRCWEVDAALQRSLLLHRTYAGTIVFRRRVWERLARFPDRSLAEDAAFLRQAMARGARFAPLDGRDHYVYVRHGRNSWHVGPGRSAIAAGWIPVAVPALPADDLAFLRSVGRAGRTTPQVSCLMPTRDRRAWVEHALELFERQTRPDRELVVVDDGDDPVEDVVAHRPGVRYVRLHRRTVLGAKRNLAVEAAGGALLAHWDDDDWYADDRLDLQVRLLEGAAAQLVGSATLPFLDPVRRVGWRYTWPTGRRPWAAGTSLLYRRELWAANRFAEVAHGEDSRFVWRTPAHRIALCPEPFVVAMIHPGNTVPKSGRGAYWSPEPVADISLLLGQDDLIYQRIALRHDANQPLTKELRMS